MIFHEIYDDDNEAITKGCLSAIEQGAEACFMHGWHERRSKMTKHRLPSKIAGARIVSYGAPVLPGAMFFSILL